MRSKHLAGECIGWHLEIHLLIATKNLSVQLAGRAVLESVDLTVQAGEIVTIIGPNGSGKTTLLKALIGAVTITAGMVEKASELRLGYVPQRLQIEAMLPMTVKRFLNLPRKKSPQQIRSALEIAGITGVENRQILALSGGQFQRILLARAMLDKPNLLLLDEATQGLDQLGIADFYKQIETIRQDMNCAVLLVSHDLNVVMRQTDRVICLNKSICCQGKPEHVSTSAEYQNLFGVGEDHLALYRHSSHVVATSKVRTDVR